MTNPINQIIRSRRKTLALIVKPDGSVIVRTPLRASQAMIQEFVEKNRQWIERKQDEARAALPPTPKQYGSGETFRYLGIAYPLELIVGQKDPLVLRDGTFQLAASKQSAAASIFEGWYRRQAIEILTERVELFARQHGFQYQKVRITAARTRWGSCNATGSLSFSWRLIQAPLAVVDYV